MIKNNEYLEAFENQLAANETVDFARNLQIYEAMWQEAVGLGILPLLDPYDGLENDIPLANILNRLPRTDRSPDCGKDV